MASSSSPSAPSSIEEKYDVFLSFRGVDTRDNITSHLYAALCRKKIETYIDYRLERGDEISPALLKAIEESKLSVLIFSQNYASSSWCLDELVHILKCRKTNGQIVVPVFYNIDPSNVRKQKGSYEVAFNQLEERFKDDINKVQEWRDALKTAANLSGWDSLVTRPEAKLVEAIVQDILEKLSNISSIDDPKGLVAIDEHVEQILSLLSIGSQDVRVVGIWGMGGIGKTTLAEVVFNQLFYQFEGRCFLRNVREESEKHGLNHLREELLSALLEEEISSAMVVGSNFYKRRLSRRKVLVVLDDVNKPKQLEILAGDHGCLGHGSRIIVTSRDRQVLRNGHNIQLYEVVELGSNEALQLFSLNAFKSNLAPTEFVELSKRVADYAKGIPLALKVLGAHLHSKSKKEWEGTLKKLKMAPNIEVQNVLRISYEGLDRIEKDIFLDIACFFKGEDWCFIETILDGCDLCADVGIPDLIDKALITIKENKVWMHDLLQEMGWEIVRRESKDLGKRSRLWIAEDVHRMLKTNTGTGEVEGIFLGMSKIRDIDLNPAVFANLYNLRLLKIYYPRKCMKKCKLHFPRGLQSLPDALRYLHWYGYPLRSLPSDFNPENLVVLEMPHSEVEQLWDEDQYLEKLRRIDLSYSKHLIQFPDLSQALHLESMNLEGCKNSLEVPSYLQYFNKITNLNLSGNRNLKNLTVIPPVVRALTLDNTGIEEFSFSTGTLNNLYYLSLADCKALKTLSSNMHTLQSLKFLILDGCSSLDNFPSLPMNIRRLYMKGTAIEEVPSQFEGLSSLEVVSLENNRRLKRVSKRIMPLTQALNDYMPFNETVSFMNCLEMDENARTCVMEYAQCRILRMATLLLWAEHGFVRHPEDLQLAFCYPGKEVPNWFSHQFEGSSININLPPHWFSNNFLGFALCLVVGFTKSNKDVELMFKVEPEFKTSSGESYKFDIWLSGWSGAECEFPHVFLWYDYSLNLNFVKERGENWSIIHNATEASFGFCPANSVIRPSEDNSGGPGFDCSMIKCGVCPLYAQYSTASMDQDVGESSKSNRRCEVSEASGSGVFIEKEDEDKDEEEEEDEEEEDKEA